MTEQFDTYIIQIQENVDILDPDTGEVVKVLDGNYRDEEAYGIAYSLAAAKIKLDNAVKSLQGLANDLKDKYTRRRFKIRIMGGTHEMRIIRRNTKEEPVGDTVEVKPE